MNGYYKSELIYGPARTGPWKSVEDVELATLSWVHWHNTARLHGYLNDLPPTEFEDIFYATKRTDQPLVESNNTSLWENQGDSVAASNGCRPADLAACEWGSALLHGGAPPMQAAEGGVVEACPDFCTHRQVRGLRNTRPAARPARHGCLSGR